MELLKTWKDSCLWEKKLIFFQYILQSSMKFSIPHSLHLLVQSSLSFTRFPKHPFSTVHAMIQGSFPDGTSVGGQMLAHLPQILCVLSFSHSLSPSQGVTCLENFQWCCECMEICWQNSTTCITMYFCCSKLKSAFHDEKSLYELTCSA